MFDITSKGSILGDNVAFSVLINSVFMQIGTFRKVSSLQGSIKFKSKCGLLLSACSHVLRTVHY